MKLIGKLLRFYTICCMSNLFFIWIDTKFTFDSPVMGYGILITFFFMGTYQYHIYSSHTRFENKHQNTR